MPCCPCNSITDLLFQVSIWQFLFFNLFYYWLVLCFDYFILIYIKAIQSQIRYEVEVLVEEATILKFSGWNKGNEKEEHRLWMPSARLRRCFIVVTRKGNVPQVEGGDRGESWLVFKGGFSNLGNLSKHFDANTFSKRVF